MVRGTLGEPATASSPISPFGGVGETLELKVNLMQLITTGNFALNSTILGLIIYQERDDKWKDNVSGQAGYMQKRREF